MPCRESNHPRVRVIDGVSVLVVLLSVRMMRLLLMRLLMMKEEEEDWSQLPRKSMAIKYLSLMVGGMMMLSRRTKTRTKTRRMKRWIQWWLMGDC